MERKFLKVLKKFPTGGDLYEEILSEAVEQKLRLSRKYIDKVVDERQYKLLGVGAPWLCPVKRGDIQKDQIIYREFITTKNKSALSVAFSDSIIQRTIKENQLIPLLEQGILSLMGDLLLTEEKRDAQKTLHERFPHLGTEEVRFMLDLLEPLLMKGLDLCHHNHERLKSKIQKFEAGHFERLRWWDTTEGNLTDPSNKCTTYKDALFYYPMIQSQVTAFFYPNLYQAEQFYQDLLDFRTRCASAYHEEISLVEIEYFCLLHFPHEEKTREALDLYQQASLPSEAYPPHLERMKQLMKETQVCIDPTDLYKLWRQCRGDWDLIHTVFTS